MARAGMTAPPSILIPATAPDIYLCRERDSRHFISPREFAAWSKEHPGARLRPAPHKPEEGEPQKPYRAPHHPTSTLLQTIPARSASRSSRANILAYTLHLTTSSRLLAHPSSLARLHRAEAHELASSTAAAVEGNDDRAEATRALGLWTLSKGLLSAAQRVGALPASVGRRVALARLAEEVLGETTGEDVAASAPPADRRQSRNAEDVESLRALALLTSPDSTTLYLSASAVGAAAAAGGAGKNASTSSIAQSLIDLKFGLASAGEGERARDAEFFGEATTKDVAGGFGRQDETVFGAAGGHHPEMSSSTTTAPLSPTATSSRLTAAPHMDYRIVRGQAMRSRAKSIFATSVLRPTLIAPSTSTKSPSLATPTPTPTTTAGPTSWCKSHRVGDCGLCGVRPTPPTPGGRGRTSYAGEGLVRSSYDGKRPLVEVVPSFLVFSAALLQDLRDRAAGSFPSSLEDADEEKLGGGTGKAPAGRRDISVSAAWFSLLHSFVIQACLEGYLVEGWTGTGGVEVLFGCGCGVWEGRGWASRKGVVVPPVNNTSGGRRGRKARRAGVSAMEVDGVESASAASGSEGVDSDDESESEDSEAEQAQAERAREKERMIEAAHAVFGARDAAQAEFERSMRDRIHEFLNVPEDSTLLAHLVRQNAKYPLSAFERDMADFLESTSRFLGQPALAKYETPTTPSGQVPTGEADPFALARYFAPTESPEPEVPVSRPPHRAWEEESSVPGKRRRVE